MFRGIVAEMRADAEALTARKISEPSREHPLHLVIIDEGAPLMAYWPRGIRDKLRKVIVEIQEPTKDIFSMRDLFPERIGLRLPTESHTEAALVDNAVRYGALCHQIPVSLPGVGYQVLVDDDTSTFSVSRNRAGHVTDGDLDDLVEYVAVRRLELETTTTNTEAKEAA
ncbi:hypothetical protein ACFQ1S_14515 [Kibdelosporangium lantanae]|uniref:DUF5753 domain-containing protein n=1 Tax=Kibdelosporangium lantanae TaxID=1497396 RepID=A0ABW3M9I7_9PSEU